MTEELNKPNNKPYKLLIIACLVVLVGLLISTYMLFVRPMWKNYSVEFEVVDMKWERVINVEEFGLVTREEWKDHLPAGAKVLSETSKFRREDKIDTGKKEEVYKNVTRQVPHEEKFGCYKRPSIGKTYWSERGCTRTVYTDVSRVEKVQEPVYEKRAVYDTWCQYEIMDWHSVPPSIAQGQGFASKPEWKMIEETPTRRIKGRTESYVLKVSRKDMPFNPTYFTEISPEQVEQVSAGSKIYLDVDNGGKPLKQPKVNITW